MTAGQIKIGDQVMIKTNWADAEFPNVAGVVSDLRHGGAVAVIDTTTGRSPRVLHVNYLR